MDAVRSFLRGDVSEVVDQLEQQMMQASEEFRFEDAAKMRDWIVLLDERLSHGSPVAQEVAGPEFIHYLRAREGEMATLVVVASGRIHMLESLDAGDTGGHLIRDALQELDEEAPAGSGLAPREADARRVLDHWTTMHRASIVTAERRSDEPRPVFAERVETLIQMHLDTVSSG